jgi:hypothetical protein
MHNMVQNLHLSKYVIKMTTSRGLDEHVAVITKLQNPYNILLEKLKEEIGWETWEWITQVVFNFCYFSFAYPPTYVISFDFAPPNLHTVYNLHLK